MPSTATATATFITPEALLQHWQGHRRLTRRMIAAFPEDKLFTFSLGGMRSFGELAQEMVGMAVPTVKGMVTNEWDEFAVGKATSSAQPAALLAVAVSSGRTNQDRVGGVGTNDLVDRL